MKEFIEKLPRFIFGILIGIAIQQKFNFPVSYYLHDGIGPGTLVRHINEGDSPFYNFCKYGQVLYIRDVNLVLVEWKHCEDQPNPDLRDGLHDTHTLKDLEPLK